MTLSLVFFLFPYNPICFFFATSNGHTYDLIFLCMFVVLYMSVLFSFGQLSRTSYCTVQGRST